MESFYKHQIPQSEYRKAKPGKALSSDSLLDLQLDDLNLKDSGVCNDIRDKVIQDGGKIVKAVFPEERWSEIIEGKCFKEIFEKLGIK